MEEPVTVSGWYERQNNGEQVITYYGWENGSLVEGPTVKSWQGVEAFEADFSAFFDSLGESE